MQLIVEGADGSRVVVEITDMDTMIGDIITACEGQWPYLNERRMSIEQFNEKGESWVEYSDNTEQRE